jgi:hypothetical protein
VFGTQKKSIDGIDVHVTPFAALEALKIQALLLRVVGPALGRTVGAIKDLLGSAKLLDLNIDGSGLSGAIAELAEKLPEEQLVDITRRMLRGVQCVTANPREPGAKITVAFDDPEKFESAFDLVFQGRLMSVYSVIAFVLKVNYPDFFQKILGSGGLLGGILSSKKAASGDGSSSPGSESSAPSAQS